MKNSIHRLAGFFRLVEEGAMRMNAGLFAFAVLLAAIVIVLAVDRAAAGLHLVQERARWPYLLMSTDAPDASSAPTLGDSLLGD
jgi:hypothetical protein